LHQYLHQYFAYKLKYNLIPFNKFQNNKPFKLLILTGLTTIFQLLIFIAKFTEFGFCSGHNSESKLKQKHLKSMI